MMFHLNSLEYSHFLLATVALLTLAHLLGYLAQFLMIPRVIGEVGAGLILGPTLLGHFFPEAFQWLFLGFDKEETLFSLMYQIGLTMLMFCSGLKFHSRFTKEDGTITAAVVIGSTILPFTIGWIAADIFNLDQFLGPANNLFSLKVVVALSVAVTSIPVISKIFNDLGIMHSRFSKLIISCAGLHDIFLWVALGVAISIAGSGEPVSIANMSESIFVTLSFVAVSFFGLRFMYKRSINKKTNILFRASSVGYFLLMMLILSSIAGYLKVETIFGALIAGIAAKATLPEEMAKRLEQSVVNISFSWFIPVYFAIVGLQLDLTNEFNWVFFLQFMVFATVAQTLFVYMSCRIIKLDHLTSFNFGLTMNARGGPGIVMSTVAYSAGIINQEFFSALVLLSLASSWLAGAWIHFVLKKKWPLMPGDENLVQSRLED